jgi:hypothetical protein
MSVDRRKFLLAGLAAAAGATTAGATAIARTLAPGVQSGTAAASALGTAAALGKYGAGVRAQVFEVIVRQGLAGAPWKEICAGPMQVNNITVAQVEAEMKRRREYIGAHPHREGVLVRERLWCDECRQELGAQAEASHPKHSAELEAVCKHCDEERKQWNAEMIAAGREHEDSHNEYVAGCSQCWMDYKFNRKAHPRFGWRGPAT